MRGDPSHDFFKAQRYGAQSTQSSLILNLHKPEKLPRE